MLADKKALREQMSKMKRSVGHYHSELHHSKREARELKVDLEKTQEALSQVRMHNFFFFFLTHLTTCMMTPL